MISPWESPNHQTLAILCVGEFIFSSFPFTSIRSSSWTNTGHRTGHTALPRLKKKKDISSFYLVPWITFWSFLWILPLFLCFISKSYFLWEAFLSHHPSEGCPVMLTVPIVTPLISTTVSRAVSCCHHGTSVLINVLLLWGTPRLRQLLYKKVFNWGLLRVSEI